MKTLSSRVALFLAITALASAATEREVADWAIRRGGRVILAGSRAPINDVENLPAGDFHITGVDLMGTLIDASELEMLSGMTGLKELYLPGPSFNPASGSRL